jgi:hypothetical protein
MATSRFDAAQLGITPPKALPLFLTGRMAQIGLEPLFVIPRLHGPALVIEFFSRFIIEVSIRRTWGVN